MHGDFSNLTFDPLRRFSRVLQQQGRVTLDADLNEGDAVLLHALRALTTDLIGPHGGPGEEFAVEAVTDANGDAVRNDLQTRAGHYWVQGALCEADAPIRYSAQVDHPGAPALQAGGSYLVYLDVWERWLSHLQVPALREVALGGADTAGRAMVVRQVRAEPLETIPESLDDAADLWREVLERLQPGDRGRLRARAQRDEDDDEPCITDPEARYRGPENQLYRVEVFDAGDPLEGIPASFVWSRDNGSVAFPVLDLDVDAGSGRATVRLDDLYADAQRGLAVGQWVELRDDHDELGDPAAHPRSLQRVVSVDALEQTVVLDVEGAVPHLATHFDLVRHPILRRWDQPGDVDRGRGDHLVPDAADVWLPLEDGVEVAFDPDHRYRSGDYWLIPARTIPGDVLWPRAMAAPAWRPPHGVLHRYAPLALVSFDANGAFTLERSLRRRIEPLGQLDV